MEALQFELSILQAFLSHYFISQVTYHWANDKRDLLLKKQEKNLKAFPKPAFNKPI